MLSQDSQLSPVNLLSINSTLIKTAAQLRKGDEIEIFFGARQKRCRIVSHPLLENGCVRLRVAPVTQLGKTAIVQLRFNAEVNCYPEPYRPWYQRNRDRLVGWVLECVAPEDGFITCREIMDRLKLYHPFQGFQKHQVMAVLHLLVEQGQLKSRNNGNLLKVGRPLPLADLGTPVVELAGTRSERIGWIVAWKQTATDEKPIVQWIQPGYPCTLSSEDLLEPLKDRFRLKQIEYAKRRLAGDLTIPFPVPEALLMALYSQQRSKGRIISSFPALLEIAAVLGIAAKNRLTVPQRNQVLEYLALYYPNWQKGGFC